MVTITGTRIELISVLLEYMASRAMKERAPQPTQMNTLPRNSIRPLQVCAVGSGFALGFGLGQIGRLVGGWWLVEVEWLLLLLPLLALTYLITVTVPTVVTLLRMRKNAFAVVGGGG